MYLNPTQEDIDSLAASMAADGRIFAAEYLRLCDIAQRLDAANPSTIGSFTGTPSERIARQLAALNVAGF